jgi:hypothetical protein
MYADFPYKSTSDYVGATGNNDPLAIYRKARNMYEGVRRVGRLHEILAHLGLHICPLRSLTGAFCGDGHYAGTEPVAISRIRGSEGRCADFDAQFRPIQSHTRERWINVAIARLRGHNLPPVELLKRGEEYYVRDGHHRISVAKALGECYVDAMVTVCG